MYICNSINSNHSLVTIKSLTILKEILLLMLYSNCIKFDQIFHIVDALSVDTKLFKEVAHDERIVV